MRKKLILDLDTGIDDALAIAYALGSADEIDLIGITATYGNVAVPLAARNALAVLHLFGRDDVPVYPGVDHPIAPATLPKMRGTTPDERAQAYARWQNGGADGWQTDASWSPTPGSVAVHHSNGIGGAIIPDSPRAPEAPGSAVDFIITAAREYGPDLTIVPTGAMTTMATVFRNAPDLKDSGVQRDVDGRRPYIARQCKPGRRSEHLPRPRGSRLSVQVWRTHHHDRPRRDPPDRAHS